MESFMNEEEMEARITEISNEYAQLPQLEHWDLTLYSLEKGDVKVLLKNKLGTIERTIGHKENLDFIADTFDYSPNITPRSKMAQTDSIIGGHFDELGKLIINRKDGTQERFTLKGITKEEAVKKFGLTSPKL
jgi:hypothetical protein